MHIISQCWTCGAWITLVAPVVYAGHYPCPMCTEGTVFLPETAVTPAQHDDKEIEFNVWPVAEG